MASDARSADGDDADLLVRRVADLRANPLAIDEVVRIETGDVPRERVVLLGPVADQWEVGAEAVGNDVVGVADEDRAVPDTWVARDVLDHLGVVVGRQIRLALPAVGHREPADEIGEPGVRGALLL